MRVLGVDPGLTRCGVGVVEGASGPTPVLLRAGVIRTAADRRPCRAPAGDRARTGGVDQRCTART